MADSKKAQSDETQVKFDLGNDSGMPYVKADLFKAARIGSNFAVVGYQLNYTALINSLKKQSKRPVNSQENVIPVAKLVLDVEGFHKLRDELNTLFDAVYAQKKDSKK